MWSLMSSYSPFAAQPTTNPMRRGRTRLPAINPLQGGRTRVADWLPAVPQRGTLGCKAHTLKEGPPTGPKRPSTICMGTPCTICKGRGDLEGVRLPGARGPPHVEGSGIQISKSGPVGPTSPSGFQSGLLRPNLPLGVQKLERSTSLVRHFH